MASIFARRDLLTDILHEEWGFDGAAIYHNIGVHGASDHAGCIAEGNDLLMPGTCAETFILKGPFDDMLKRKDLELSAKRIAALTSELA